MIETVFSRLLINLSNDKTTKFGIRRSIYAIQQRLFATKDGNISFIYYIIISYQ